MTDNKNKHTNTDSNPPTKKQQSIEKSLCNARTIVTTDKKQFFSEQLILAKDFIKAQSNQLIRHVQRNKETRHINRKIYHLLCRPHTFINAYTRISKNKAALTKAVEGDEEIMKFFGITDAIKISKKFIKKSYKWKPVRRVWIPKPAKPTKRPMDTPSQQDRIVQEAIRGILEAIFEPEFREFELENNFTCTNYGFRPNLSTWNAVESLKIEGQRTNICIQGDIKGAYNSVDHDILLNLLKTRITDKSFLKVIKDLLKSGIMDKQTYIHTLTGTPQGGIVCPLLFNIYMFPFDKYIYKTYIEPLRNQKKIPAKQNPQHKNLGYHMNTYLKKWNNSPKDKQSKKLYLKPFKKLQNKRFKLPSYVITSLPKSAVYSRYADDWTLLITGSIKDAIQIKQEISTFISSNLQMTLDPDKTLITKLQDGINFLGYTIQMWKPNQIKLTKIITSDKIKENKKYRYLKRTTSRKITIRPCKERLLRNLLLKKYCDKNYYPIEKRALSMLDELKIVEKYRLTMLGICNYYRNCDNHYILNRVSYILQYSCAKTLAHRQKITMSKIFKKYGTELLISRTLISKKGNKTQKRSFPTYTELKKLGKLQYSKSTTPKQLDPFNVYSNWRTSFKLYLDCCLCNSNKEVAMHHINSVRCIK